MLTSAVIGGGSAPLVTGTVYDLPDERAQQLVAAGHAEVADPLVHALTAMREAGAVLWPDERTDPAFLEAARRAGVTVRHPPAGRGRRAA